jgi:hypothetical protein
MHLTFQPYESSPLDHRRGRVVHSPTSSRVTPTERHKTPPPRGRAAHLCLSAALTLACSKRQVEPKTSEPEPPPPLGATPEAPVPRCGAADSYQWVARDFRCADGNNPLGGDPRAGARARVGSLPSPDPRSSHFLDLYEVPCAEGPQRVYIDMYACPHQPPPRAGGSSEAFDGAFRRFEAGDFAGFLSACGELLRGVDPSDRVQCLFFMPSAQALTGDLEGAKELLRALCAALPPPSEHSSARADLLQGIGAAFQTADKIHPGRLDAPQVTSLMLGAGLECGLSEISVPELPR